MPQSLASLYVHGVYSTKGREPLLLGAWREELFTVLGGIANNIACQSLLVGEVADHAHHLFRLGRTITPAGAVGRLKTKLRGGVGRAVRMGLNRPFRAGANQHHANQA